MAILGSLASVPASWTAADEPFSGHFSEFVEVRQTPFNRAIGFLKARAAIALLAPGNTFSSKQSYRTGPDLGFAGTTCAAKAMLIGSAKAAKPRMARGDDGFKSRVIHAS